MNADQFAHMIKHAVAGTGDVQPFRYGHIASYDPQQHRVRCIIPSMTDQDGTPTLSPWMPMGTLNAGNGYGVQVIYAGGATVDNPTAGEQVLIAVFDPRRGVAAVPCMFYHGNSPPPATDLPKQSNGYPSDAAAIAVGDVIISAPPAQAGGANSVIRLRQSGDIETWCAGTMTANVVGDMNLTSTTGSANVTISKGNANITVSQGNATLTAKGTVTVAATAITLCKTAGDAVLALCTDAFRLLFNTHTHGTGPVPTQQAGPSTVTSILKAE